MLFLNAQRAADMCDKVANLLASSALFLLMCAMGEGRGDARSRDVGAGRSGAGRRFSSAPCWSRCTFSTLPYFSPAATCLTDPVMGSPPPACQPSEDEFNNANSGSLIVP